MKDIKLFQFSNSVPVPFFGQDAVEKMGVKFDSRRERGNQVKDTVILYMSLTSCPRQRPGISGRRGGSGARTALKQGYGLAQTL